MPTFLPEKCRLMANPSYSLRPILAGVCYADDLLQRFRCWP